jgi:hypothetical protein
MQHCFQELYAYYWLAKSTQLSDRYLVSVYILKEFLIWFLIWIFEMNYIWNRLYRPLYKIESLNICYLRETILHRSEDIIYIFCSLFAFVGSNKQWYSSVLHMLSIAKCKNSVKNWSIFWAIFQTQSNPCCLCKENFLSYTRTKYLSLSLNYMFSNLFIYWCWCLC